MLTVNDLKKIDFQFTEALDRKLIPVHKDIKIIKRDVKKLRKDIGGVIDMADKGLLSLQKRVGKVENHLGLAEPQIS